MCALSRYLIVGLVFFSASVKSADITCDTGFQELTADGQDISSIDPRDLDVWLSALKDDDCAKLTISKYGNLSEVVEDYSPGAKLDEIEIVNKSGALLAVLNEVLARENFYGDKENLIRSKLPKQLTIATVPDLVFDITSVDIMSENAIFSIGNAQVDEIKTYEKSCQVIDSNECKEWERYVRFFAAMTYAVEDIAESKSRIQLATLRTGLSRYISDWDDYYQNRKPQMPWELLTNELWNRDVRESKYFPKPPANDLVIFHPQVVYTEFDSIDSEVEIDSSILWEVIGINYWDKSLVTGVSLVSTNLKSSGSWGLLVTFKNIYALGVLDEDDDDDDETWFVSVDLFDFFANKKNEFEEKLNSNLEKLK